MHASNKTCSIISTLEDWFFIIIFAISVLENESNILMKNFSIDIEVTRDDVNVVF
jgi:hypothetical protein